MGTRSPLRRPENWIDLALALVLAALTYGAAAPEAPGPHVHFPAWAWVLLGLAAVGLRVVHRWWGDPQQPQPASVTTAPPSLTRDDPPAQVGPLDRVGALLPLLFAAGLLLGSASGCDALRAAAISCTTPAASTAQARQLHAADAVLDQVDAALAAGITPDSADWRGAVDGLLGDLGRYGWCVLTRALTDLLGHLDAQRGENVAPVLAACSICRHAHHAHAPRPEQRAYLKSALRQLGGQMPAPPG